MLNSRKVFCKARYHRYNENISQA